MASKIDVTREDYKVFYPISTRWMDNDVYGHVNNVTYYSYFDTAANTFLINHLLVKYSASNLPLDSMSVERISSANCSRFLMSQTPLRPHSI